MNASSGTMEDAFSSNITPPASRRKRTVLDSLISPFTMTIYALLLGLGLGLGSAYYILQGDYPFSGIQIGPWRTWPTLGSDQVDPYARAIMTKRGDIPLAIGEGLALRATVDSAGRPLDAACSYRVGPSLPQTRLWTLSVYDGSDRAVQSDLKRSGFTSSEILRNADGSFAVLLSPELQPGNWIKLPGSGPFSLYLRVYEMPGVAGAAKLQPDALPAIERLGCGA